MTMEFNEKLQELRKARSLTQEELAEALKRQFAAPGFQTLDHLPMYHCERCLIYCPVGHWKERFADTHLTRFDPNT